MGLGEVVGFLILGSALHALGFWFGASVAGKNSPQIFDFAKTMSDLNKSSVDALRHVALFRHDKAEALKDDKAPALYFGPDGKIEKQEDVEQVNQRLTDITNQILNSVSASDDKANEMMEKTEH